MNTACCVKEVGSALFIVFLTACCQLACDFQSRLQSKRPRSLPSTTSDKCHVWNAVDKGLAKSKQRGRSIICEIQEARTFPQRCCHGLSRSNPSIILYCLCTITMGNLNSREMAPFMDHEITKHVLMNLGDFLKYHGEHEKHRAARSSKRHKRQEEARKRASQPPSPNYHYYGDHHHHHHEPSNPHASRRGIDYYPQGYHEEAPFAEQDRHGGRRNHSNHYDSAFIHPRNIELKNLTSYSSQITMRILLPPIRRVNGPTAIVLVALVSTVIARTAAIPILAPRTTPIRTRKILWDPFP